MLAIKGLVTNAIFIDNAVNEVAKFGEITTHSLTFSREKGIYSSGNAPELSLITFLSAKDGVLQPVAGNVVEHILDISKFIYDKTLNSTQQVYGDELLNELIAAYAGKAERFSCGAMIQDGQYWMPEWVSWKCVEDLTLEENEIRVWFVDDSFKEQYDEFAIEVVPPFDNLDDFFKTGTEVENLIKAIDDATRFQRIQNAKGGHPETIVRSQAYNYIDPYNANHKVAVNWGLLIYGAAGNNIDAIKKALEDYILAHSTHSRAEWTVIFPDIFKRTEFILVPLWNQYAIPNKETQAGLYSQVVNLAEAMTLFKNTVDYPDNQLDAFASVMGHAYKGLAILAVGSPDNRDSKFRLKDIFPDYLPVSTTSLDFNRMSQPTRDWMLILQELLLWGEEMTEYSSIPTAAGYTKTKRDGVLYIVKNYQNINYLVAAKKNFPGT